MSIHAEVARRQLNSAASHETVAAVPFFATAYNMSKNPPLGVVNEDVATKFPFSMGLLQDVARSWLRNRISVLGKLRSA